MYNEEWVEYYQFLEELRQSGETNMFGATPYLREFYPHLEESDKRIYRNILLSWMENYEELLEDGIISRD